MSAISMPSSSHTPSKSAVDTQTIVRQTSSRAVQRPKAVRMATPHVAVVPAPHVTVSVPAADNAALALLDGINCLRNRSVIKLGYHSYFVQTPVGRVRVVDSTPQNAPAPCGTRGTLILLPGFASQAIDYAPLLKGLKKDFDRVVALDLPGHGYSDTPDCLDEANITAGTIAAIDIVSKGHPSTVCGNSMGGAAAVRYALARPAQVEQMILISPLGAPMTAEERVRVRAEFIIPDLSTARRFVNEVFGSGVPGIYSWLQPMAKEVVARCMKAMLNKPSLQHLANDVLTFKTLTPEEVASLPYTTLIWGKKDHLLPGNGGDFFAQHLQHAAVFRPDNFNHVPYIDHAEAVEGMIRDGVSAGRRDMQVRAARLVA